MQALARRVIITDDERRKMHPLQGFLPIDLQRAELLAFLLQLDKDGMLARRQDDPVWHACMTWADEFEILSIPLPKNHAKILLDIAFQFVHVQRTPPKVKI